MIDRGKLAASLSGLVLRNASHLSGLSKSERPRCT